MSRPPKILVFDSGLGGLTVYSEIIRLWPGADYVYCADDAGFPYGSWKEPDLIARVLQVIEKLIAEHAPDMVVIACNTASTIVLPALRDRWPRIPFVGTVPAIKPAAERSRSHLISVLGTPGTVARDYTQHLISQFAAHCCVTLVGSSLLAQLAEARMQGRSVCDEDIAAEMSLCFKEDEGARTDAVVLACTHYPLLVEDFRRLAPWPVDWIDPAPAIARRVDQLLRERGFEERFAATGQARAVFTSGAKPGPQLLAALAHYGLVSG
ncbi:glutamate racemase [Methylocystis sp.]|jgi:glutamate racemase|uniref:glutamate racemase n=1 Tax=Methylocystis sp. TaxID=1911079 RepID=UPI002FB360BA